MDLEVADRRREAPGQEVEHRGVPEPPDQAVVHLAAEVEALFRRSVRGERERSREERSGKDGAGVHCHISMSWLFSPRHGR